MASVDTMRGVAILGVVLAHTAGHYAPFGGLIQRVCSFGIYGVQLFFLISAWTMCHVWFGRKDEGQKVLRFYIRRLCRIAPPFWLAIVVYGFANGWQVDEAVQLVPYMVKLALSALLLHSFVPGAIDSVVPGGWSIGVEVAFYLVFPLFAWIVARKPKGAAFALLVAFVIGVCLQAIIRPMLIDRNGTSATPAVDYFLYFSMLTQIPVFLLGIVVYQGASRHTVIGAVGMAMVWLTLAYAFKALLGLPGRPGLVLPVLCLAALLWLALHFDLHFEPLAFLGRMSYSVYLFHFLVIRQVSEVTGWNLHHTHFWPALLTVLGVSMAIGEISRSTLEKACAALAHKLIDALNAAPALKVTTP
jgi:exopolysaccharide production protein ExoZ